MVRTDNFIGEKMEDTKGLLKSLGVWGSLLGFAPLVNELVVAVPEATAIIVGAVGGLVGIYGRIRAKSKIKGLL